jgi:serine/threonine protein kinase
MVAIPTQSLPPELAPYAQDLEDFKRETGIRLLLPPLGVGGGGTVLRAQNQDGKQLAIKVIAAEDAASRDQALREASILKQVQHAKAFGGGEGLLWQKRHQRVDLFFLAMDFIPGQTLTELIASHGPLAESVAIDLAIGIARELEILHSQNIIHRDVKPDNVMLLKLGRHYQPIVVDYGIAKMGNRTWRGARAATDGYAPPEQYKGGTDRRTDVYALGATLYEMLTGLTPFASIHRDPSDMLNPRQHAPTLSLEVELVVQIATAYHPKQRFSSMGVMIDALRLAQDGNRLALWSMLQALGLLGRGLPSPPDSTALPPADVLDDVPALPPLPLKTPTPQPKIQPKAQPKIQPKARIRARGLVCPHCQQPCQAGEAFCADCGAALDPAIKLLPAPAQPVSVIAVASNLRVVDDHVPRTPRPQLMSLIFARQIVLGGPALGGLSKFLLLLSYWFLLAGVALGARSLSIVCSLVAAIPIGLGVFFFLLFPLFARMLSRWDDIVITRRGQAHWLRRSAALLLGLVGLATMFYWLVGQVMIWKTAWFLAPPPLSIIVYAGMASFAAILIEALLS